MKLLCTAILLWVMISCNSGIKYPEGGYEFPKIIRSEDSGFYFVPIRDSFSRRDSFYAAVEGKSVYKFFDEPNLSLKPAKEDIFRLCYGLALGGVTYITVTRNFITVKQSIRDTGYHYYPDSTIFTEKEKYHLELFQRYYPFDNKTKSGRIIKWKDSLINLYPELLDVKYYFTLVNKTLSWWSVPKIKYSFKEIPITGNDFEDIVSLINKSEYWNLPVHIECINQPFDGYGYTLEANAGGKYNYVISGCCENQQSMPFAKACQKLIDKAGLGEKIQVYWDGRTDSTSHTPIIIQDVNLEPVQQPEKSKKKKH